MYRRTDIEKKYREHQENLTTSQKNPRGIYQRLKKLYVKRQMDFSTYHSAPSPAWGMYTVTMVTESLVRALSATVDGAKMERQNMQHLTQKTTAFSIGIFFLSLFFFILTNTTQAVLKGIQWR